MQDWVFRLGSIQTLAVELTFNSVIKSFTLEPLNTCSQLKFLESMVMIILLFSDGRFFLYYRMSQWFALHDLSRMAEHCTVAGGFKYHPKITKNCLSFMKPLKNLIS